MQSFFFASLLLVLPHTAGAQECELPCHSGQGVCIAGRCFCRSPWGGDDCSRMVSGARGSDQGASDPLLERPTTARDADMETAVEETDAQSPMAAVSMSGSDQAAFTAVPAWGGSPASNVDDVVLASPVSRMEPLRSRALPHTAAAAEVYEPVQQGVQLDQLQSDGGPNLQTFAGGADTEAQQPLETPSQSSPAEVSPASATAQQGLLGEAPQEALGGYDAVAFRSAFVAAKTTGLPKRRLDKAPLLVPTTPRTAAFHVGVAIRDPLRNSQLQAHRMSLRGAAQKVHIASEKLGATVQADTAQLQSGNVKKLGDATADLVTKHRMWTVMHTSFTFADACPYILAIFEGLIFLCVGTCACAGAIADRDKEDSIEIPWYCAICVDSSQCCVGLVTQPFTLFILVIYLAVINVSWYYLCSENLVETYFKQYLVVVYEIVLVAGALISILFCIRHRVRDTDAAKRFTRVEQNVEAMTVFFQAQYGRKFYNVMKRSGQFSQDQLSVMKTGMMSSGHMLGDKLDDITDFMGLTECSSDDDTTIWDVEKHLKECVVKGNMSQAEADKRLAAQQRKGKQKSKQGAQTSKTTKSMCC